VCLEDEGVRLAILGIRDGDCEVCGLVSLAASLTGDGAGGCFVERRLSLAVSVGLIVRAPKPLIRPETRLSVDGGVSDPMLLGFTTVLLIAGGSCCWSSRDSSGRVLCRGRGCCTDLARCPGRQHGARNGRFHRWLKRIYRGSAVGLCKRRRARYGGLCGRRCGIWLILLLLLLPLALEQIPQDARANRFSRLANSNGGGGTGHGRRIVLRSGGGLALATSAEGKSGILGPRCGRHVSVVILVAAGHVG